MPGCRNYIVAAGTQVGAELGARVVLDAKAVSYPRSLRGASGDYLCYLAELRFIGDACAVQERTLVFRHKPPLQALAPAREAQLLATFVLNEVRDQSIAATKAVRIAESARGRRVVDFGSRRAHGVDAALKAARALFLAGGHGGSNVLAMRLCRIPDFGNMEHSYIQAHEDEQTALEAFASFYPEATLLGDTYDTLEGVRQVIAMSRRQTGPLCIRARLLDSRDAGAPPRQTRQLPDGAGPGDAGPFASGVPDEYRVRDLVAGGASHLDLAYMLVEFGGTGRMNRSAGKRIHPGREQVFRCIEKGQMMEDVIGRFDESQSGERLLQPVVLAGRRCGAEGLKACRARLRGPLAMLPASLRSLEQTDSAYPVRWSDAIERDLQAKQEELSHAD